MVKSHIYPQNVIYMERLMTWLPQYFKKAGHSGYEDKKAV